MTEKYGLPQERRSRLILENENRLKEARNFKAQPMPNLEEAPCPVLERKSPTKPEPFELQSVQISAQRRREIEEQQLAAEHEAERKRHFKARPAVSLDRQPYVPAKSTLPLTHVENVVLQSELRAKERQIYNARQQEGRLAQAVLDQQAERELKAKEARELELLRQTLVHKANTIRHYKNLDVQPSDKPLTDPASPKFQYKSRRGVEKGSGLRM